MSRYLPLSALVICLAVAPLGCGGSGPEPGHTSTASQLGSPYGNADEPAGGAHLSRRGCAKLGAAVERHRGAAVRVDSEPAPPHSSCRLTAPGVSVDIDLDASFGANQRYQNRMVEQYQFGFRDKAKLPQPVPGVGDPGAGNHNANWVPALHTLFAVRGNRWLTITYASAAPGAQPRAEAIRLARLAFPLTLGR